MITQIMFLLVLPFICLSCHPEKLTTVEEITHPIFENSKYGIINDITSLFFISPEIGFSCMPVRKELGSYPTGTALRQTTDGGKTWTTLSFFKGYVKGIQYLDGVLYAYYNESDKKNGSIFSSAHIIVSKNGGNTWDLLYVFDNEISNFHVFNNQNMSIVKKVNESDMIYQSKNGGETWVKASVPNVDNISYMSRDNDKLYYIGKGIGWTYGKTSLFSYDVVNEVLSEYCFDIEFIFDIHVSDGMLSFKNGGNIKYYTLKNKNFEFVSKIDWGSFFGGSVMSRLLAKDGKYVFSFISQFPGGDNIKQALYFSDTRGEYWRRVREFKFGEGVGYESYNVYKDDTIFQIAHHSMDSIRIFRIKK